MRTGLLASVRTLDEALIAARAGADIIDMKAPEHGSLGALPADEVRRIVLALDGLRRTSATIGDLPMDAGIIVPAVEAMAATGVDYVKIGIYPNGDADAVTRALTPLCLGGCRIVAVLFGDCAPGLDWPTRLAERGFTGCMLDTLDKALGPLTAICSPDYLEDFVAEVRATGLLCGLAGSLGATDIPRLLKNPAPDYLGFRGALCTGRERTAALDPARVEALVARLRDSNEHSRPRIPPETAVSHANVPN
ncbi:MAG: (5-formylfuran-3-yl)methyl phosphate synthase [Methylotetracoccus sp.]